jgi:glycosyltransferase involved in cell wall biosynthesis
MNRVVVVQKSVPHYRVPFFEGLRRRLADEGTELVLVYGQPVGEEAQKDDSVELAWGRRIVNRTFSVRRRLLVWQPVLRHLRAGDLVIVEQASKLLVNYVLLALQRTGRVRVAFWGHGRNLSAGPQSRLGEAVKRFVSRQVHWWFAYTARSGELVAGLPFPAERVTAVQNAIDTRELADARRSLTADDVAKVRDRLNLRSENVAIFCGALYRQKRLEFLLEAAAAVRARVPDFELIVLGAGPDRALVDAAAADGPWIHCVGPVFGAEKAAYFEVARALLLPGLVGLAVVDSFVFETPLVAIDDPGHAPEIEYLEHERNGLLLAPGTTAEAYADAVAGLLSDPGRHQRLTGGCRTAATRYTVENMIERFADGVLRAVAA